MFDVLFEVVDSVLGLTLTGHELEFSHMAWRGLVVFLFAVALVRVADRRFLGNNAGYDIVLAVVLGSVLSRAINGDAAFFPTLGVTALLILLHHLLSTAAFRWRWFSHLIRAPTCVVIKNGVVQREQLSRCKITEGELAENLRLNGNEADPSHVEEARLEQNGRISVVLKRRC